VIVYDVVLSPPGPDDSALAAAIRRAGDVILAASPQLARVPSAGLLRASVLTAPAPGLVSARTRVAHVAVTQDPGDGVIRSVPLVIEGPTRRFVPGLSLAALAALEGADETVTLRPHGVQVGAHYVPTGRLAELDVNYSERLRTGAAGVPYVSAADALTGRVGDRLRGSVVFVGVTEPTLGDVHLTPTDKSSGAPGVFVHANALNTILTRGYLSRAGHGATLLWVFALAFLAAVGARFLRLWAIAPLALALYAAFLLQAFLQFDAGTVANLVYPGLAVVAAVPAALGMRYLFEDRRRRRVATLFAQYVPATVARQLLERDRAEIAAAGERLEVTVLFCDLRGFTALAAAIPAPSVRDLLNVYYRHTTAIVLDHGGTLMQYVGDEVFAVFGAPLPIDDHVTAAYECALALQRAAPAIAAELTALGVPPIAYGIGLHCGEVVAAHVGGDFRRQYAVVGNPVNVGARLCSLARAGEIVISGAARARLAIAPDGEPLGEVALKGVSEAVLPWRVPVLP
jgi:adenylate cyclase